MAWHSMKRKIAYNHRRKVMRRESGADKFFSTFIWCEVKWVRALLVYKSDSCTVREVLYGFCTHCTVYVIFQWFRVLYIKAHFAYFPELWRTTPCRRMERIAWATAMQGKCISLKKRELQTYLDCIAGGNISELQCQTLTRPSLT